jgi:hypothetical protein
VHAWLVSAAWCRWASCQIECVPNTSLKLWKVLSAIWLHPVSMHFQRLILGPWVGVLRRCNGQPSYRHVWRVSGDAAER